MSVRRNCRGKWTVDICYEHPDGTEQRVTKTSPVQTRRGAERYERQVRQQLLEGTYGQKRKEVPLFDDWFNGRYWDEWVISRKNKPSTQEAKKSTYQHHLEPRFGHLRLDQIGVAEIGRFRAALIKRGLTDKTVNNVLAVLSKPLNYAADVEVIAKAPKVGLLKVERPEIVWWEFDQYARILEAARKEGHECYAAVCLAGEAGLRVGEVKALKWRRDVDLIAGTITVTRQTRRGIETTPKGRTRRVVPMTSELEAALRQLSVVRTGLVIRHLPGQAKNTDNQVKNLLYRVCRKAGLPERGWHCLRHTYGTHAALFGVNAWRLMAWLGHKRIEETMRYVHVSGDHWRETPSELLEAGRGVEDPDKRVLAMLGARHRVPSREHDANVVPLRDRKRRARK